MGVFSRLRLAEKPAPRPDTQERGDTGMAYAGYRGNLYRRLTALEYNSTLTGSTGYRTYDKMRLSDPKVAGLRRAMNLPLLGAGVRIEPADPDDERAIDVAEFVQMALLADGPLGMQEPWKAFLSQALLYLDYGCAPFEMVWALQDGHAVIERFAYRPPSTVYGGIDIARGRIAQVEQTTSTGANAVIPGEKLFWLTHEREGDNFLGRPLLRPMYKPWFSKEQAEILLLINLEKGGGIPFGQYQEGELTKEQKTNLESALESLHISERAYLLTPDGVSVSMLQGSADLTAGLELVRYFDTQLSTVAIAEFRDLGKTATGSWALSRTLSDAFTDSLGSIATTIEDEMNAAEGPIAQLVAYNFAGADDLTPRLRFDPLEKADMKTIAAGLLQLSQAFPGMLGPEHWEWVCEQLDLPVGEQDRPPQPRGADGATPPAKPAANTADDEPVAGGVAASELSLAGGQRYWRPLTQLESYVALDEISGQLDNAKDAVREATQKVRDRITAELVKRAMAAVKSGEPAKVAALASGRAPDIDSLTREMRAVFERYFDAGRRQVTDELARQRDGEPVVDQISADRAGQALAMADTPPRMTTKQARRFYELLDLEAEIAARAIGQASVSAAAAAASAALSTSASAEVIGEAVRRASDSEALRVGFRVTKVMIDGRSAQAQEEREQIETATYSAILDGKTCEVCEDADQNGPTGDGNTTADLDEAETWCPNPGCLGGVDRCRCMVLYSYKEGA